MSNSSADQEPSIEEILASIRQIISDDQEPEATPAPKPEPKPAPKAEAAPAPKPEPKPAPKPAPKPDILELTEDMQDMPPPKPAPKPEPKIQMEPMDMPEVSTIISEAAASAALGSISKLTGNMPISRSKDYDGVTLEDIVRELLYPMLRQWVDGNLPPMVERLVQKELQKLSRQAMDE